MANFVRGSQLLGLVFLGAGVFARNESHPKEHNYTVGVFLREEGTWGSLEKLAREVSDPRSASYGQYLNQAQLTQRVGISKADAEAAARSLQNGLKPRNGNVNGSTAHSEPGIVTHRDVVVMTVQDFFATYSLGQALTENLSNAWPESVHMLVTPPMPDGVCSTFGEEECNKTKPCKWHRKEYIEYELSQESVTRPKKNHSQNHSQSHSHNHSHNHSHQATCTGSFAGWICWRERLVGLRSEAQWHCFEPANFKGVKPVKPSNSSNATEGGTGSHRATAKRRRRGVEVSQILERMERMESAEVRNRSHRKKKKKLFHAVARSGGFGLLTRGNRSLSLLRGCQSLEITFRQDDLVQNRLLKHEDFVLQGRLHMAAVNSLKNLRHVSDIFVCFNNGSFALAPPGQPGCDCEMNEIDNETETNEAWGWDNRLGRDCEKVWGFGPSNSVLPRGAQSLEALYRDLQASFLFFWQICNFVTCALGKS